MQGFSCEAGLALSRQIAIKGRRVGVFGGAFDPPHNAHVALAKAAIEQLDLAVLHIIPTGNAWHKARSLTAPAHRLAMARLAFDQLERALVDGRELQRVGPTFTIDTLAALQDENPGAQLYLFIGADQFAAFEQWHRWKEILDVAIICIADRAGSVSAQARFDQFSAFKHRFLVLELPLMSVSATGIRKAVVSVSTAAKDISQLVPEAVARYISLHRLYRTG